MLLNIAIILISNLLKLKFMRKLIYLVIFLNSINIQAQDDNRNLKYKSFSVSLFPHVFLGKDTGGFAFSGDISFVKSKNLYSFSFFTGSDISIMGSDTDFFMEMNLLYVWEFKLGRYTIFEGHTGLGYFYFSPSNIYEASQYRIAIPVTTKLRFQTGKKFSVGLQLHGNFNTYKPIYSLGVLLQWNKL